MGAVTDAEDMGINSNGWPTEGRVQHHIGRFAPHAGQGFECSAIFRHFTLMLFQQDTAGFNHVLGFAVKQADGFDVLLDAVYP
ncbi:hypothetical protein D3C80_2004480 [compost metagenome]